MSEIDWDDASKACGSERILRVFLTVYLDECPKLFQALEASLAENVAKETQRAAHTIKGGLRFFKDLPVRSVALQIEKHAEKDEMELALSKLPELQRQMDALLPKLKEFVQAPKG